MLAPCGPLSCPARLLPTGLAGAVRAATLETAGWRCAHCRATERRGLACQEVWRYADLWPRRAGGGRSWWRCGPSPRPATPRCTIDLAAVRGVDAAAAAALSLLSYSMSELLAGRPDVPVLDALDLTALLAAEIETKLA